MKANSGINRNKRFMGILLFRKNVFEYNTKHY